jgi:hypothetical protein
MESETLSSRSALEKEAKYLCNQKCGRCPMAVENYPCPAECSTEITPWQCWIAFFSEKAIQRSDKM